MRRAMHEDGIVSYKTSFKKVAQIRHVWIVLAPLTYRQSQYDINLCIHIEVLSSVNIRTHHSW